jgi:hypothetical protein
MPIRMAAARTVPDVSVPGNAGTLTALTAAVTGGVYRAPQIRLAAGVRLALASDLILVADDLLQIDGVIGLAQNVPNPVNVVLVSLNGSVRISPAGKVGVQGQLAAQGADDVVNGVNANASSAPGVNGGYVKILAPQGSIFVEGEIHATTGGPGGLAAASGQGGLLRGGGAATAFGGQAGSGGDVLLGALEGIVVNVATAAGGLVEAGAGGVGGTADAVARTSDFARADGGPGNVGGTVTFVGLGADPTMFVNVAGWVIAGSGGRGGPAAARVVSPALFARGGSATASGGQGKSVRQGEDGGTVVFRNCVAALSGRLEAGNGGSGGDGTAIGGDGASRPVRSRPGGPAEARGGHAGQPGKVPEYRTPSGNVGQGQVTQGGPGVYCTGGDATAVGGRGGPSPVIGKAGDSGIATATGGTGCSGQPAPTVPTGPVPPGPGLWAPGGVCPPAVSRGTP